MGKLRQEALDILEHLKYVEKEDETDMIAGIAWSFSKQLPVKAVTWELVKTVTNSDPVLQQVISFVMRGFPEFKSQLPMEIQEFWAKRESLYVVDNVLL